MFSPKAGFSFAYFSSKELIFTSARFSVVIFLGRKRIRICILSQSDA